MLDRTARLEQYRAHRIAAMANQAQQQGVIDLQMWLVVDAMSQAFAQFPAFQQPAAAAAAAPQIIQQLPTNAVKLPVFHGTVADPTSTDAKAKIKSSPASVTSCLSRLDIFFETYDHLYPTNALKLNVFVGCFPSGSTAQEWYERERRQGRNDGL